MNEALNNNKERINIPIETEFFRDKTTLLLNINFKIPGLELKRIEAKEYGLLEKNEFHLTVIGFDTGEKILKLIENLDEEEKEKN